MKTITLFLIGMFLYQFTKAQRVTYSDLKYVLYHNISETEDYLSKKGFTWIGVDTLGDGRNHFNYVFKMYSDNNLKYMSVDKSSFNGMFYEVSFFTTFISDYQKLKYGIKNLGFRMSDTHVYKGDLVKDYKKGNLICSFLLHQNSDFDYMSYFITLTDSDLEKLANNNENNK